jgi:hypothetical protein
MNLKSEQVVEETTAAHATSPATKGTETMIQGEDSTVVQPFVSEVYKDEKERRLAEFVIAMDKNRADAKGVQAREIRDMQINTLAVESDKV